MVTVARSRLALFGLLLVVLFAPDLVGAGDSSAGPSRATSDLQQRWDGVPLDATLFELGRRDGREMILTDSVRGLVHLTARGQPARVLFDDLVSVHGLSSEVHEGVLILRGRSAGPMEKTTGTLLSEATTSQHRSTGVHRSGTVSLVLEAVSLEALLDLLAAEHGLTVVSGPRDRTRLWIHLVNRPIPVVFDMIGRAIGVTVTVTGTRVRFGPRAPVYLGR